LQAVCPVELVPDEVQLVKLGVQLDPVQNWLDLDIDKEVYELVNLRITDAEEFDQGQLLTASNLNTGLGLRKYRILSRLICTHSMDELQV